MKKNYDQPRQHIEKQRHYFASKDPSSWSYGFSSSYVWMWEWTIKKVKCWSTDAFELLCWRRLLRVPWFARGSIQSILSEISPEYWLESLVPKLKLQCFGHLMQKSDSLGKSVMLGKIEFGKRKGWQNVMWLDGITTSMDMSLSRPRESVLQREAWSVAVHGVTNSQIWLSDWNELKPAKYFPFTFSRFHSM